MAAATLLYVVATTPPGAFFLHVDTADQDFAAVAWARGCWEYSTEKMIGVFLLAPLFRWFGPSTAWETGLLSILAAVTAAAAYELGRLLGRSRLAGLGALLLTLALPAYQYFSRTHIGYVTPWLLLAWLAAWHRRWAWAGFLFSLVLIGHFGYTVIVGASILALAACYLRPAVWRDWLKFGLAGLAPLLALEALFFAYMGRPFQWARGTLAIGLTWSGVEDGLSATPDWLWAPRTIVGSNGWLLGGLLGLGLLAPLALRATRAQRAGLALSLSNLAAVALYSLVALRYDEFISRPLAPLYPLLAAGAAAVFAAAVQRLGDPRLRTAAAGVAVAGLAAAVAYTGSFIREFTRTPFPRVEQTFRQSATAGRPVRYNNVWFSLYYAQVFGVEVLTGDGRWIEADQPGQAVLIFEDASPPGLARAGYTVESTAVSATVDRLYPVLTREARLPRRLEVWWPAGPSQTVKPAGELPPVATFFPGAGCVTPPAFGDGTLHFFQLAWHRIFGAGSTG